MKIRIIGTLGSRGMDAIAKSLGQEYNSHIYRKPFGWLKCIGNTYGKRNRDIFKKLTPLIEGGIADIDVLRSAKDYMGSPIFDISD